ncbi:hypothetical protein AGABI1DRAFT_134751 [Agaricus bisporus var. burnettii JB137-S8]|uniref:Uncharacterized protein n=1 Tax=Agaricus bisporus var. burnettii (strain JB137-S8 / ATCC MYA-4627 / FGSC 10392) TaxID=597362 RepID=K5WSC2_AGABU|nr:uncharacterized protein AGABI1DRAFT_134751 [Agaricus bisporus var. burnettii JB137-S8]EKM73447.1 hypothetical protein AGABI1DRAFT_134751 [Agaricus bisporus var. burnettii JB137-S8]
MLAPIFPSLCPSAARTVRSRVLALTPAPSIALAVSAGATILISVTPSAPAAPSALVLTPRPITSTPSGQALSFRYGREGMSVLEK